MPGGERPDEVAVAEQQAALVLADVGLHGTWRTSFRCEELEKTTKRLPVPSLRRYGRGRLITKRQAEAGVFARPGVGGGSRVAANAGTLFKRPVHAPRSCDRPMPFGFDVAGIRPVAEAASAVPCESRRRDLSSHHRFRHPGRRRDGPNLGCPQSRLPAECSFSAERGAGDGSRTRTTVRNNVPVLYR